MDKRKVVVIPAQIAEIDILEEILEAAGLEDVN